MKAADALVTRILETIEADGLAEGAHLPAQGLADRLRVSRSPVNEALAVLHRRGVLRHEKNRGYFLARPVASLGATTLKRLAKARGEDVVTRTYFRMAEDRLAGALPEAFTEAMLKRRYDLSPGEVDAVIERIAAEGWAEKKPGYGWAFSAVLTTPDALLQSYRMRLALEPQALLEPGYRLVPAVIERLRVAERHLLDGGIETDTPDRIHERGVRFHEALVEASGNPFFIDAIRRVNRVRRLLSYRAMLDRSRYREHCEQHLRLLDLLAAGRQEEAAEAMRHHLARTLRNFERLRGLLAKPESHERRKP